MKTLILFLLLAFILLFIGCYTETAVRVTAWPPVCTDEAWCWNYWYIYGVYPYSYHYPYYFDPYVYRAYPYYWGHGRLEHKNPEIKKENKKDEHPPRTQGNHR